MKPSVILYKALPDDLLQRLQEHFTVHQVANLSPQTVEQNAAIFAEAEGLLGSNENVDAALLEKMPKLRLGTREMEGLRNAKNRGRAAKYISGRADRAHGPRHHGAPRRLPQGAWQFQVWIARYSHRDANDNKGARFSAGDSRGNNRCRHKLKDARFPLGGAHVPADSPGGGARGARRSGRRSRHTDKTSGGPSHSVRKEGRPRFVSGGGIAKPRRIRISAVGSDSQAHIQVAQPGQTLVLPRQMEHSGKAKDGRHLHNDRSNARSA